MTRPLAAAAAVVLATALAGCGVKAPPRPPVRQPAVPTSPATPP